jgi:hypothetical protein
MLSWSVRIWNPGAPQEHPESRNELKFNDLVSRAVLLLATLGWTMRLAHQARHPAGRHGCFPV